MYKIEIKPKLSRCVPPLLSEEDARDPEVWSKFEGRGREARGWRVIRRIRDRRNETNEEHVGGTIRGGLGDSNGSGIIRSQDREGERGGEKLVGDEEQRKRGGEGGTQKGSKLR